MRSSLYTLAGSAATAMAAVRGFNYGSQSQTYETFVEQFQVAAGLVGADDFSSARLYTMIQDGTSNTVISAIPAAIATETTLLLGLWASEDQATFDNELTALKNAISQYGSEFADLVVGISVGSEDLYRNSPTGIENDSGVGQEPSVLVDYIGQVRTLIEGTVLSEKLVGHVDTWNDFVNSSNSAVVAACDFLGLDEYPFYQTTDDNDISNGGSLFFEAYDKVVAVAGSTPIWITESGWPVSGDDSGDAVPSIANAETYWQDVACQLISRGIDFWWYILVDAGASPSFGVTGSLTTTPLYDLSCGTSNSSSSSAVSSSTRSASSVAQATTPTSAAASTTVNISNPVPTAAVGTGSGSGAAANASSTMEATVYVTDVTTSYTTTCPVGYTLTTGGSTTVLQSASVITTTTTVPSTVSTSVLVAAATATGSSMEATVYVTDVTTSYTTTCPVGYTLTTGGSTTVLESASVITTTTTVPSTVSTSVLVAATGVGAAGTGAVGTAASGSGYLASSTGASTLASSWAGSQTPTGAAAASTYTGAASKMDGSMAALALGAVAAVIAL